MSDFKYEFKKSILDHGTIKLSRYVKEQRKHVSFQAQMSGSAVHFTQWPLAGGAPLRARFDLLSMSLVSSAIQRAIVSKVPMVRMLECSHKPKDGQKTVESNLVVKKDSQGIISIGIHKPGTPLESAEMFEIMPNYFIQVFDANPDNLSEITKVPKTEINANFAKNFIDKINRMAEMVGVKDYKEPPKKDDAGGYSQPRQAPAPAANNSFDNDFADDFGE